MHEDVLGSQYGTSETALLYSGWLIIQSIQL